MHHHHHASRRSSFVDRVLDGRVDAASFPAELVGARSDERGRPPSTLLGLDDSEISLVEQCPDALRYVLHSRRFDRDAPLQLTSLARVREHALALAAEHVDPWDLADIEEWSAHRVTAGSAAGASARTIVDDLQAASHA